MSCGQECIETLESPDLSRIHYTCRALPGRPLEKMQLKILLILPTQYTHDGKLFKNSKAFFPTLTLPYLAGFVPGDVDVSIRNDYVEDIDPAHEDCDLVGITISTLHAVRGYELADQFRAAGRTVILGGFHATFMTDEALEHCDAVVKGEGEESFPRAIEDFRNGRLRRVYEAGAPHSLAGLPMPRYDLIPYHKYRYRSLPVQTSRGCPNNCGYCTVSAFHGRKYRFRPVGEVVEEIRGAVRLTGARLCMFIDDNIGARPEHSKELFEALIPLKIHWVSQSAITMADDPELLRLAARSGMRGTFIGIESLNSKSLKKANKHFNQIEQYAERLRAFRNAGISVSANIIFGFDEDTEDTFEETFQFIRKTKVYANPYLLTPYPGTKLFEDMEQAGRLLHRDWRRYTAYQQVLAHPELPQPRAEDLFWRTYLRFYAPGLNFKRIFNRPLHSFLSFMDWFLYVRIYFTNATFVSRRFVKRRLPPYF